MNIIDIAIVLLLILGAVVGFKRGAIKSLISFIGLVIALVLAAFLKDSVSIFMYKYLPFFNFGGIFKGVSALNILLYEVLAYFLVLSILLIGVKILSFVGNTIEKALKLTIILAIPSKILGIFVGFIENYVYVFVVLYFLSLPMFNISLVNESTLANKILNNTPLLSSTIKKPLNTFVEIYDLSQQYNESSKDEFNRKSLDLLIRNEIISIEATEELIDSGKLKINNEEEILNKYRED